MNPEQLHLIREVIERIENDTDAALISLDQSKAFNNVDHRFLVVVLETAGFEPESHRWINMLYRSTWAVVQVNEKHSGFFVIERAKVSLYADDITVFVSRLSAVKEVIVRNEQIARAKINFDKSKRLRLGVWRGGLLSLTPGATDPFTSLGYGLGPAANWSEIGRRSYKGKSAGG